MMNIVENGLIPVTNAGLAAGEACRLWQSIRDSSAIAQNPAPRPEKGKS
jgi:hypothetical protein